MHSRARSLSSASWTALAIALLALPSRALATVPADLCTGDPCVVNDAVTVAAGSALDFGAAELQLGPLAVLTVGAGAAPRAISLRAAQIVMQPGARLLGGGDDADVTLEATAGDVRVRKTGSTSAQIDLGGAVAGAVTLLASADVTVAGVVSVQASGRDSQGGEIVVDAGGQASISGDLRAGSSGTDSAGGGITITAAGDVTVSGPIDAAGGNFGGANVEIDSDSGSVVVSGAVDTSGAAPDGSAGAIDVSALAGAVTLSGPITGKGGTGPQEACGDGAEITLQAGLGITVSGAIDVTSGRHCLGGSFSATAGGDFTQFAGGDLKSQGLGIYGSGGEFEIEADGNVTLRNVDLTSPGAGGTFSATARFALSALGKIDASGTGSDGYAGQVTLEACEITVAPGAEIASLGIGGGGYGVNLLRAGGAMTVAGTLKATDANQLDYLTASPVVTGTVTPTATASQDGSIPACPVVPVCGNGTVDTGEVCDDGNTDACDGCDATCKRVDSVCGDGTRECGEACDDGNDMDGDGCEATCVPTPLAGLRRPGAPQPRTGCMVEWALPAANAEVETETGFARATQHCTDGDPQCDTDGAVNGVCAMAIRACLRVPDPGLPDCAPAPIQNVKLKSPVPGGAKLWDTENAAALTNALAGIGVTVKVGSDTVSAGQVIGEADACTELAILRVPSGAAGGFGQRKFNLGARDEAGLVMGTNQIRLRCEPPPISCGNGVLQSGEECDDGAANGTPGNRCSAECKILPPPTRIPGGGPEKLDCPLEWAIEASPEDLRADRRGIPTYGQSCKDNDPTCDFDPTVGTCRFHVWACFGGADERLACPASLIKGVSLQDPDANSSRPFDVAARSALDAALGEIPFPLPAGEVCSRRIDLEVPTGTVRLNVRSKTSFDIFGQKDTDALLLRCRR